MVGAWYAPPAALAAATCEPVNSPARLVAGHPGADHPGRLRHVDRRHAPENALVLLVLYFLRLLHAVRLPYAGSCGKGGLPGGPGLE